jgi:hypothetical protein
LTHYDSATVLANKSIKPKLRRILKKQIQNLGCRPT